MEAILEDLEPTGPRPDFRMNPTLFQATLDRISTSAETIGNVLTDGKSTATWNQVPALTDGILRRLESQGIGLSSCLAVECANSLPGALLLVALFRRGISFVLVPPPVSADLKPVPRFCTHKVVATGGSPDSEPETALLIESNPDFSGLATSPGKLYLRTSGSMGASKIVVHSHAGMIGNAQNCILKYGFRPASRATIPVPIAHMYGFGAEFLPAALAGASIDLQDKTNLLKYLDREKKFEPTIVFATPAICDMLAKGYKKPRTSYEVFVTSGQRISEDLFRAFDPMVSGRLINQYGSTEMGATAAANPGDPLDARATTIGKPMNGVQLRVIPKDDTSNGSGELHCLHPYGFEGYLDEEGAGISHPEPGAWYRTGDLAIVQPDGEIVVTGRADASVNRSGYLVLLAEIERILEKLEGIGEIAVVAATGESSRGQRIAAFCVPSPGGLVDPAKIRERCFELLPHYAIPDEVRAIPQMPLLASGKIDRRALAALMNE